MTAMVAFAFFFNAAFVAFAMIGIWVDRSAAFAGTAGESFALLVVCVFLPLFSAVTLALVLSFGLPPVTAIGGV